LAIFAIEAIEAGFVEVNETGSAMERRSQLRLRPHFVVILVAVGSLVALQERDQSLHIRLHTAIDIHQFRIQIGQDRLVAELLEIERRWPRRLKTARDNSETGRESSDDTVPIAALCHPPISERAEADTGFEGLLS
jgi:hypothetical protein